MVSATVCLDYLKSLSPDLGAEYFQYNSQTKSCRLYASADRECLSMSGLRGDQLENCLAPLPPSGKDKTQQFNKLNQQVVSFALRIMQTWNLSKILHRRIFRLKILYRQFHLILTVLVRKTQKMSENGEIYTAGKNFTLPPALTAWTNSTSGMMIYMVI